jgi:hypothetical protein
LIKTLPSYDKPKKGIVVGHSYLIKTVPSYDKPKNGIVGGHSYLIKTLPSYDKPKQTNYFLSLEKLKLYNYIMSNAVEMV